MKKILLILISLLSLKGIIAQQVNDPNAEVREAKDFHAIEISNAFDLYLDQGNDEAVAVSASDEKFKENIKVEVANGVLRIWFDGDKKFWKGWNSNKMKLKAYVSFKNLDKIRASGACNINTVSAIKLDNLLVDLSGASDLRGNFQATKLEIKMSGASDIDVSGTVSQIKIDLSGACDFKGYDLATDYCNVSASGASSVKITVNKELSANISGASDIYYKGNGALRDVRTSGASSITRKS
jgi:hypothetical protein